LLKEFVSAAISMRKSESKPPTKETFALASHRVFRCAISDEEFFHTTLQLPSRHEKPESFRGLQAEFAINGFRPT